MITIRRALLLLCLCCFPFLASPAEAQVGLCGDGVTTAGEQCDDGKQCEDGVTDCTNNASACAAIGGGTCAPRGASCCSAACTFAAANTSCDDGNACRQLDLCDGRGNCRGYEAVACSAPAVSDPSNGSCAYSLPDQPQCGNGHVDAGEQCDEGRQCVDGRDCTGNPGVCAGVGDGSCEPRNTGCCTAGCGFATAGTACDDANACTSAGACNATGQCAGTSAISCGDCSSCNPFTGACDTCRDINNPNGYCDTTTRECVNSSPACAEFQTDANGVENKCTVSAGVDPDTGACVYQPKACAARGCNVETCEPSTGECVVTNPNVATCDTDGLSCINSPSGCKVTACTYTHCLKGAFPINCDKPESINCSALNPSTCQVALGCTLNGGELGTGCQYDSVVCAPPSNPCAEQLVRDGTAAGCCTYVPKDCAAEFGNDLNYTYSCTVQGAQGVCHANNNRPAVVGRTIVRQPGAPGRVEVIATVTDDATPAGSLTVTLAGPLPAGVTVSGLTNTNGTITAFVAVAPGASFGPKVIPLQVTDGAGATGAGAFTVTLQYAFIGFLSPVDNPPVLNSVKAGLAVPVKFSLGGNYGLGILAAGSPTSLPIACNSGTSDDIEEVTTGNGGLTYDAATNQYSYVWKTQKGWGGTCRQLVLTLNDGSTHSATFQFK